MRLHFSDPNLRRWFWLLLAVNALYLVLGRLVLHPLTGGDIVDFEVARDVSVATALLEKWKHVPGKTEMMLPSIYWDYFFIGLYTAFLSVTALFFSRFSGEPVLQKAGRFIPVLIVLAAVCDVIENMAMTHSLSTSLDGWSVRLAYDMAVAKFSVLILIILFFFTCLIFALFRKKEKFVLGAAVHTRM